MHSISVCKFDFKPSLLCPSSSVSSLASRDWKTNRRTSSFDYRCKDPPVGIAFRQFPAGKGLTKDDCQKDRDVNI